MLVGDHHGGAVVMEWLRRRRSRGQSLVEFALILPVFILLLVGLFDVGRAVYGYNTVSNASREAARVAIVDQTLATIKAQAVQRSVSLGVTAADVDVAFRNQDLSNTAPCNSVPVATGCIAEVTVNYSYSPATPIIGNIIGTLNIASTARMPVERTNP